MDKPLFGFIGCGNMGSALARAARKNLGASQILLANRTAEKALQLSRELGCRAGDQLPGRPGERFSLPGGSSPRSCQRFWPSSLPPWKSARSHRCW